MHIFVHITKGKKCKSFPKQRNGDAMAFQQVLGTSCICKNTPCFVLVKSLGIFAKRCRNGSGPARYTGHRSAPPFQLASTVDWFGKVQDNTPVAGSSNNQAHPIPPPAHQLTSSAQPTLTGTDHCTGANFCVRLLGAFFV